MEDRTNMTLYGLISEIVTNAQTPTGGVFVLSSLMILGFIIIATRLDKESPLWAYPLQFIGVLVVVPALMFLGVTKVIDSNAVSAAFGAIVAYFFFWCPFQQNI